MIILTILTALALLVAIGCSGLQAEGHPATRIHTQEEATGDEERHKYVHRREDSKGARRSP